jgi:hypothetical protein
MNILSIIGFLPVVALSASITAAVVISSAPPAASKDISGLADRWTEDLQGVTDKLIVEARRLEDISGKIPLPGGSDLGIDDLLNEDPEALALKMGQAYSAMVDGLAEARPDIDVEDFRASIAKSMTGFVGQGSSTPAVSNDPHVIASMIDENLRDLVSAAQAQPGYDYGIASRLRYIASEMERQADILEVSE